MGKISISKYAVICVLGGEIAYSSCLAYGTTLNGKAADLHHALFELLPGFAWLSFGGWAMGAVTVAVWAALGGAYIAWMHNFSLEK